MKNAIRMLFLGAALGFGASGLDAQACPGGGDTADRASPPDSATASLGGDMVKVCYGAPSARGRTMVGGDAHPYGTPWRLGANEATAIHLPFAASVAGVDVPAGSYSLYAVVGEKSWDIVVNGVAERWGRPISEEVMASDVGSGTVPVAANEHVERLMMSFEDVSADSATLVVEWEAYRVEVPVVRTN